jgi:hypothetical protein
LGPAAVFFHLLGFALPALAVAFAVAFAAPWLVPGAAAGRRLIHFGVDCMAGLAVLAAGLWHFGVDGKMATYAALAIAVATCQWLCSRCWKG